MDRKSLAKDLQDKSAIRTNLLSQGECAGSRRRLLLLRSSLRLVTWMTNIIGLLQNILHKFYDYGSGANVIKQFLVIDEEKCYNSIDALSIFVHENVTKWA